MNTCDHYSYVKTKAYTWKPSKTYSQICACDPNDLYGDQALSSSLLLKMSNKEDFKEFEPMKEKKHTFHPVNLSLSRVNYALF